MPGLIALIVATVVAAGVIRTLFLPLTTVVFLGVAMITYITVERVRELRR